MSSNACKTEKRRAREAAYDAGCREREQAEAERERKFSPLRNRLEELGIDPCLLSQYLATFTQ